MSVLRCKLKLDLQYVIRRVSVLKNLPSNRPASIVSSSTALFVEPLMNRALLRVRGDEVHVYLQGLITNDMNHLNGSSGCMYAMFLNGKGRVLHDTIIYRSHEPNTYIIEGDLSALNSLKKHLLIYRVRKKIGVESADDLNVWVINKDFDFTDPCNKISMKADSHALQSFLNNCLVCCDPRIPDLGIRIIAPKDMNVTSVVEALPGYRAIPKNFYKSLRYKLGVGEGVEELASGQSFPLEANCDYLRGVSFHKGCYIGQELTARTYHTGIIRKRLMPINFLESININERDVPVFLENDSKKAIGKLKGAEGTSGIALLRIEEVLKSPRLRILDKSCTTVRPFWWPNEGSAKQEKVP